MCRRGNSRRCHCTNTDIMTFDFKNEFAELLLGKQPVLELFEPEVEIEVELPDLEVKPLPLPLPLPLPVNPDFEIPDLDLGPLPWKPFDPDFKIPDMNWEPLPLPLDPDLEIPDLDLEPLPWTPFDPDLKIPDFDWEPLPWKPFDPDFKFPEVGPEDPGTEDSENSTPVNRLYNSSQGRHLFSSNENEIDILTGSGWENEGALYLSPEEGTAEVFRFYVSDENRHFYTALESERDMIIGNQDTFAGWQFEGEAFSAYSTSDYPDEAVAVVRYLNQETGNHVYSTSTFEQSLLNEDSNWLNEGVAWYGDSLPVANDLI